MATIFRWRVPACCRFLKKRRRKKKEKDQKEGEGEGQGGKELVEEVLEVHHVVLRSPPSPPVLQPPVSPTNNHVVNDRRSLWPEDWWPDEYQNPNAAADVNQHLKMIPSRQYSDLNSPESRLRTKQDPDFLDDRLRTLSLTDNSNFPNLEPQNQMHHSKLKDSQTHTEMLNLSNLQSVSSSDGKPQLNGNRVSNGIPPRFMTNKFDNPLHSDDAKNVEDPLQPDDATLLVKMTFVSLSPQGLRKQHPWQLRTRLSPVKTVLSSTVTTNDATSSAAHAAKQYFKVSSTESSVMPSVMFAQ